MALIFPPSTMTTRSANIIWRPEDVHDIGALANYLQETGVQSGYTTKAEILDAIDATIDHLSDELRELSLSIHGKCSICYLQGAK